MNSLLYVGLTLSLLIEATGKWDKCKEDVLYPKGLNYNFWMDKIGSQYMM